jgi:hypothetical protein
MHTFKARRSGRAFLFAPFGSHTSHVNLKFVDPANFVAITIQNRDQSFAIHVKGSSNNFAAPTLDIRADRGSYCRFKLEHKRQLQDAINVILTSASRN